MGGTRPCADPINTAFMHRCLCWGANLPDLNHYGGCNWWAKHTQFVQEVVIFGQQANDGCPKKRWPGKSEIIGWRRDDANNLQIKFRKLTLSMAIFQLITICLKIKKTSRPKYGHTRVQSKYLVPCRVLRARSDVSDDVDDDDDQCRNYRHLCHYCGGYGKGRVSSFPILRDDLIRNYNTLFDHLW